MINLVVSTFDDGTSCPVSLQIHDLIYNYSEDNLFEKLINYRDYTIHIDYTGYKTYSKDYIIEDVILNGTVPTLKLKDIQ
jgi:hypothetical protein